LSHKLQALSCVKSDAPNPIRVALPLLEQFFEFLFDGRFFFVVLFLVTEQLHEARLGFLAALHGGMILFGSELQEDELFAEIRVLLVVHIFSGAVCTGLRHVWVVELAVLAAVKKGKAPFTGSFEGRNT